MAVAKVDKSAPQDAAAKKARAVARAQARHKARSLKPGAKKVEKTSKKVVTKGQNPVSKVRQDIKVIKRMGGTIRFAKALKKIRIEHKAKATKTVKKDEKKEAKKPKTAANKFRVCRMRKIYRTQLPMSYAPAKGCAKHPNRQTKLRKSIVPGTVCIILAGRHQSKKVVFLKQLKRSGLLLVTGPHKVNGIPLRRVDQKHVIATSVCVPLPAGFKVPGHIDDLFFKHARATKRQSTTKAKPAVLNKKSTKVEKKKPNMARKLAQHAIDKSVLQGLKKHQESKMLFRYMKRTFTLIGSRYPHELKF